MTALTCAWDPIRNWDYIVTDASGAVGELVFEWPFERGVVRFGRQPHRVQKHGLLSGRWTLERGEETVGEANKPSALARKYILQFETRQFCLTPEFILIQRFKLLEHGQVLGRIAPVRPFAGDFSMQCSDSVPKLIQLFCLWLAMLSWRRYP